MAKLLGHQHHSKPVTKADKVMSVRHLAHRSKIDQMTKQFGSTRDLLEKSIEYNKEHAKEHLKAIKDREKEMKKMAKDKEKSKKK